MKRSRKRVVYVDESTDGGGGTDEDGWKVKVKAAEAPAKAKAVKAAKAAVAAPARGSAAKKKKGADTSKAAPLSIMEAFKRSERSGTRKASAAAAMELDDEPADAPRAARARGAGRASPALEDDGDAAMPGATPESGSGDDGADDGDDEVL